MNYTFLEGGVINVPEIFSVSNVGGEYRHSTEELYNCEFSFSTNGDEMERKNVECHKKCRKINFIFKEIYQHKKVMFYIIVICY